MDKISKIKGIELIFNDITAGLPKQAIMAKFGENWRTPIDTFDKWYKVARTMYEDENKAKETERQRILSETMKDEISALIATENEIDLILSQMVRGNVQLEVWKDGTTQLKDIAPGDIVRAADLLYKRKGSYAPAKVAETDTDGNDKKSVVIFEIPNNGRG